MELTVGTILEGTVKTITKFGAFIALPEGATGMVHISEVAHAYVNDIREHLTEGQTVKVMVVSTENGKVNLSIKKALPQQERPAPRSPRPAHTNPRPAAQQTARPAYNNNHSAPRPQPAQQPQTADQAFEDKLKQFLSSSEGKISDLNRNIDGKRGGGRRRR